MPYEEQEYHRRRSEMELERAMEADRLDIAVAHLELARLHRAQRQAIARENLKSLRPIQSLPILRAKEA